MTAGTVAWRYPPGLPTDRGTVATVGTFDGVHLGHWRVLQEIRARARETGRRSVMVTFDPHPLRIVRRVHDGEVARDELVFRLLDDVVLLMAARNGSDARSISSA